LEEAMDLSRDRQILELEWSTPAVHEHDKNLHLQDCPRKLIINQRNRKLKYNSIFCNLDVLHPACGAYK
jgi:hypothetical protein